MLAQKRCRKLRRDRSGEEPSQWISFVFAAGEQDDTFRLHDICNAERPAKRNAVDAVEHRVLARGVAKLFDVSANNAGLLGWLILSKVSIDAEAGNRQIDPAKIPELRLHFAALLDVVMGI